MRKLNQVFSVLILIVFAVLATSAQAPPAGGQGRGQAAAAPAVPVGVDAATTKKMVAAAEAAAIAANAQVAIAVVDGNGDLVYFERMDGASARAVTSSQGKARAALLLGVPTKEAQDAIAAGKPLPATLTAPPAGAWEITIGQGGLPILKNGKVVAAMGCGGSLPANDEKFCQAGIAAMGKLGAREQPLTSRSILNRRRRNRRSVSEMLVFKPSAESSVLSQKFIKVAFSADAGWQ